MPFGFVFYGGSRWVTFDLEDGPKWGTNAAPPLREGLVASEATVKKYLTKKGVEDIKSIKIVEPKYPKNERARDCDFMLRSMAKCLPNCPHRADHYRKLLVDYCGVEIELSKLSHLLCEWVTEPKYPKHEAARLCDEILELFAQRVFEYPEDAELNRNQLIKYCGVEVQLS